MDPLIGTAFWTLAPGVGELRTAPLAPPQEGESRVRMLYSGVSRGTESLVFHGRVPLDQAQAMRGPHQEGEFPFPVKYGYMAVGSVETGPLAGRSVFCLHPHQDRFVVPTASLTPLPPGLPPQRAVLAANMETALNAVWDAQPGPGDRVTVVGGGVVGCLVAWLVARFPATTVTLVDPLTTRAPVAAALGVDWVRPTDAPSDQDLVFHASGQSEGLRTAMACAGTESMVVELSWYGNQTVPAPLGGAFHSQRLILRSSQVGRLPPHRTPRWTHRRRLQTALTLLQAPALDVLIDSKSAFADLPRTMMALTARAGALCHRVVYPGAK